MDQAKYFRSHKPRCLENFEIDADDDIALGSWGCAEELSPVFKIRCKCGSSAFKALGHYWKNPDTDLVRFVSPLTLSCESCHASAPLFDIEKHGYDAEMGDCWSTRGEGNPEAFECNQCGPASLEIYTRFEYPDDLFEEDFDAFRGGEQDLFTSFSVFGLCYGCSKMLEITDYECA